MLAFVLFSFEILIVVVTTGFEFTLLVVGESGLGKTTLTNSLFNLNRQVPAASELVNKKVEIKPMSVDIEDRGVKLKLTGLLSFVLVLP